MSAPARLPDAASVETVLAGLDPALADALHPAAAEDAMRSPADDARDFVHLLMDRIEAIDREIALPFGWFFLMTHGQWVEADVGLAIAQGLKAQRVRPPDPDAAVLLRWAERTYGF